MRQFEGTWYMKPDTEGDGKGQSTLATLRQQIMPLVHGPGLDWIVTGTCSRQAAAVLTPISAQLYGSVPNYGCRAGICKRQLGNLVEDLKSEVQRLNAGTFLPTWQCLGQLVCGSVMCAHHDSNPGLLQANLSQRISRKSQLGTGRQRRWRALLLTSATAMTMPRTQLRSSPAKACTALRRRLQTAGLCLRQRCRLTDAPQVSIELHPTPQSV